MDDPVVQPVVEPVAPPVEPPAPAEPPKPAVEPTVEPAVKVDPKPEPTPVKPVKVEPNTDIESRIKALERREMLFEAKEKFREAGLDTKLVDVVAINSVDDIANVVEVLKSTNKTDPVAQGFNPMHPNVQATQQVTKAEFRKMKYDDKVKLLEKDPALYEQLSKY